MSGRPIAGSRSRFGLLYRILIATALISSFALVSPRMTSAQPGAHAPAIDQGTLTIAFDYAPSNIDPADNEIADGMNVERNIYEGLIGLHGSEVNVFDPVLATSWSSNADKSVWTFHLRHGVQFHTGRCCMTADDVKYSIGRVAAAQLGGSYTMLRYLTAKDPFSMIKVVDPYTVEFDLGRPQPTFINATAAVYNPLILDSKALKAHATKSDLYAHNWAQSHDLGTGPYTIQSWQRNVQVTLVKFPGYWGGWSGKHFSTVVMRTILQSTTRRELVERGEADVTLHLTPQDNDAARHNPKLQVYAPFTTLFYFIHMTEYGPLASPYARQALSYAFPYDAFIHGILHGYARRSYGPIPTTVLGYNPNMFHYNTDLAKAKALFARAGVKPGTTLTFQGVQLNQPAGLLLQAQLAQIGINLKLQEVTADTENGMLYGSEPASKRPNLIADSWYPDYNDPWDAADPLIGSDAYPPAGTNGGFYHNTQVDALLADMKNAPAERAISDAKKMQAILAQDPPAIYTDERAMVNVMAANLQGLVINPFGADVYTVYPMYRS